MSTKTSATERGMKLVDSLTGSSWAAGFKPVVCTRKGCTRWLTQRHLLLRNVGVTLEEQWYCGYRCFASAMERRLERLFAPMALPTAGPARMPIGLLLFRRGLLSSDQLRRVNEQQRSSAQDFGEIAERMGFVDERQVTEVRAEHWRCPIFHVPQQGIRTEVTLPATLMRRYSMAPLHQVPATGNLLVGFVQAIEYGVLYGVEQVTGWKTQPCLITPSGFALQLEQPGGERELQEVRVEGLRSAAEGRQAICNHGLLINAHHISIARCRDFVWARLQGGQKTIDLLLEPGQSL